MQPSELSLIKAQATGYLASKQGVTIALSFQPRSPRQVAHLMLGHGHGHGDGPEGDSAVVGHAVAEDVEDGGGNNSDEEYAAAQEWREAYAAARLSPAFWGPW